MVVESMELLEVLRLNLISIFSWGYANMSNKFVTFEIDKIERRKLSYDKCRYNYTFIRAACISIAIGFLLKLIGLIAKPQNNNLRLFCDSAILPSIVIGIVFFIIATVGLALSWIPKTNEKISIHFDQNTKIIEISTRKRKAKKIKVHSINVISSENLIIFRGLVTKIMLPLSCFNSNELMLFLSNTKK